MLLRWRTRDRGLFERLRMLGLERVSIEVLHDPGSGAGDRLDRLELDRPEVADEGVAEGGPVLGVGWATVDLERAASDAGLPTLELPADRLLGARAARLGGGPLVLLEPNTEGRMAAALARRGEGPIALYVAAADLAIPTTTGPTAVGPFGPAMLLEPGLPWGPFLLGVDSGRDPSATIGR
jgi:hypothetical protein